MRQFHYYHTETGEIHSKVFKCDPSSPYGERDAAANSPAGHAAIEARCVEHWKMRVDLATKKLVPLASSTH